MKRFLFTKSTKILLAISLLLTIHSCKKADQEIPPVLPPESAFVMDFSDFNSNKSEKSIANHVHAAVNVAFWNVFITLGLAVPVVSYAEALKHEPVKQSDNTWVWTYGFKAVVNHQAKLTGTIKGAEVEWKMYITKEGSFTDFLWYEGTSDISGTYANWTLYKSPDLPTKLLSIEWKKDSEIKYTNIEPDGAENGGFITYGFGTDLEFDVYYNIYNKGKDNLTEIQWNKTNKNGRVKDANRFSDDLWHCWDSSFVDIDCN